MLFARPEAVLARRQQWLGDGGNGAEPSRGVARPQNRNIT